MDIFVVYRCEPFEKNYRRDTFSSLEKAKEWINEHGRLIYVERRGVYKFIRYTPKVLYKKNKRNTKWLETVQRYWFDGIPLYYIEIEKVK